MHATPNATANAAQNAPPASLHRSPAEPGHIRDRTRAVAAAAAIAALAPAALFIASAVGRSLQPMEHEPARTLQAIVDWFGGLPAPMVGLFFLVLPPLALALAAFAAFGAIREDAVARGDIRAFARAAARLVRHPVLIASLVVLVVGLAIVGAMAVHAIAG